MDFGGLINRIHGNVDLMQDIATKCYFLRGVCGSINGSAIGQCISGLRTTNTMRTSDLTSSESRNILDIAFSDDPGIPETGVQNRDPYNVAKALVKIKTQMISCINTNDELLELLDNPGNTLDFMIANAADKGEQMSAIIAKALGTSTAIHAAKSKTADRAFLIDHKEQIVEMMRDFSLGAQDYEVDVNPEWHVLPLRTRGKLLKSIITGSERGIVAAAKASLQNPDLAGRVTDMLLFGDIEKATHEFAAGEPGGVLEAMT